jgi:hypothetical protein
MDHVETFDLGAYHRSVDLRRQVKDEATVLGEMFGVVGDELQHHRDRHGQRESVAVP